jgi:hypothetical protein
VVTSEEHDNCHTKNLAKSLLAFVRNPLAKANGNDKYQVILIILIHCRPIYGTDRGIKKDALAPTPSATASVPLVGLRR